MADHCAVTIPLEKIRRIQICVNTARKSLAAIKKETGADYILNGTLYNMKTFRPNCHLKAEGRVLACPAYTVAGYAWNQGPDISMDTLPDGSQLNYIACTPLIVSGAPVAKLIYDAGQGGRRGRSAIGIKAGRLALYCTRDGSSAARTPEQLRDDLAAAGWESAVMLDGGGSSQCDFRGRTVRSSRVVHDLILVYLNQGEALEPKGEMPMVEINAYSKGKDGEKKLSSNFRVRELACKDGSDAVLAAPRLVMVLQTIRDHFDAPVTINSGYRTPQYNAKVGGAAQSQHCYGTAADIVVKGVAPAKVAAYARRIMPNWGGVGTYTKQGFVHVDVREQRSDWSE